MVIQLLFASLMVLVTVLVHLVGLAVLLRVLRLHRLLPKARVGPLVLLLTATVGLFAIHTVEIWLYAALYLGLGATPAFEEALYYSTVTYASIGYGDVLLAKGWRILGAIEGTTGVIMLGWSTAFLVSLLAQLKLFGHDWLYPSGQPKSGISDG
ncbi:ion channel [Sphingomonas sp.]|uniref:ion channel n=1 Tax=Sphingomonas sp. TaxID=28214 RepID=UPI0025E187CB|nr:ion channel [Sphingomonas sp.]